MNNMCLTCVYDLDESLDAPCKYCYNTVNKPYWESKEVKPIEDKSLKKGN